MFNNTSMSGMSFAFPDTCLTPTPAGPVPVTYPNTAMEPLNVPFEPTIFYGCGPAHTVTGKTPTTLGDQAGVSGGVASGTMSGPESTTVPSVTVFANGTVIRAQERSENLYASIDLVASKLARQLRRFKDRHSDHHHSPGHRATETPTTEAVLDDSPVNESLLDGKEAQLPSPGVRRKYFAMPPMTLDEARTQLDLIDHDFYLFRDSASDELQVIYRRNHGGYGVIQARN